MTQRNTFVRSLHDIGAAAWFGGSLAGALGINGAARDVPDPTQRLRVARSGWARWSPVNATAIGMHLLGGLGLLRANKRRVRAQPGVAGSTTVKAALTAAAVAVTAYTGALGAKLHDAGDEPVTGGTEPSQGTSPETARLQQHLRVCQWLIPGLTGALVVLTAVHGEQQRPAQQLTQILAPGRFLREAA